MGKRTLTEHFSWDHIPTDQPIKNTALQHAITSLLSLRDDCAALIDMILQWVSETPTRRTIDREMGDLTDDRLPGGPLCHYLRYDVGLDAAVLDPLLKRSLSDETIKLLREMDDPKNMRLLHDIGTRAAAAQIVDVHFPSAFNLKD